MTTIRTPYTFCDSCLTAAYDEAVTLWDGNNEDELVDMEYTILAGYAELLPDHLCDHVDEPEVPCDCETHKR